MTLVARLHASDMFDNLYKEDEQPRDREIELDRNQNQREIGKFVLALPKPEGNMPEFLGLTQGVYLSWLMNNSPDTSFTLQVQHLDGSLDSLGYNNDGKVIRVIGNGGSQCGYFMVSGRLIIEGDVEDNLGSHLQGGLVEVRGNAGYAPGHYMKGGELHIYGNAGEDVGRGSIGGKIFLHGECENIWFSKRKFGTSNRAKIYHKGCLIFKGGRPVK